MKSYISVFIPLFIILSFTKSFAQPVAQDSTHHAIQVFLVDDVSIAYMYKFTNEFSLRVSTDVSAFLSDRKIEENEYNFNSGNLSGKSVNKIRTSEQSFTLFTNFFYRINFAKLVLYGGIGPFFGVDANSSETSQETTIDSVTNINKYSNSSVFLHTGGSIVIGIEVNIVNNIMLLAEYEATAGYHWRTDNSENFYYNGIKVPRDKKDSFWLYKLNSIKIGFGIYL